MINVAQSIYISSPDLCLDNFVQDEPFHDVRPAAAPVDGADMIDGVSVTPLDFHADTRGSLCELLTTRDGAIEPIVHVYQVTAGAGSCRAWLYHRLQHDRLAILNGSFRIVLYDIRPGSPTLGCSTCSSSAAISRDCCAFRLLSFMACRISAGRWRPSLIFRLEPGTQACPTSSGCQKTTLEFPSPSMTEHPFFSVIMATYGRGRHIKPTIQSVLGQTFTGFELIVVGDGCMDDTEEAVRSFSSERIKWLNLPHNTGSQSFPNNEGILSSRGSWTAYIGHDDIWSPSHLERIFQTINAATEAPDFVVSGCVYYGPEGSGVEEVTGLFEEADAPYKHFFPPTSFSHRRDVTTRIGYWRDPRKLKAMVDNDFLLRAANGGMRFVSTGEITAHKFAAGHRYLSYLRPGSDEQDAFLRALTTPPGIDIDGVIRRARKNGGYMTVRYADFSGFQEGYLTGQSKKRKGLDRPALQPLLGRAVIEQTDEPRGLDWHEKESQDTRYRWSGPNPRPKILIPYTGHRAHLSVDVISKNPDVSAEELELYVEGESTSSRIEIDAAGVCQVVADIPLRLADYTVLTLHAPIFRPAGEEWRKIGVAVGDIVLEPI